MVMKSIVVFIFFSFMFLTGVRNMNETFQKEERIGMVNAHQKETPSKQVLSSAVLFSDASEMYVDPESLGLQFHISSRGYQSIFTQQIFISKSSSLPRQSWSVTSFHYVFGLRRILI